MALSQAELDNPGIEDPTDENNPSPADPNASPAVVVPAATPVVDELARELAEAEAAVEAERLAAAAKATATPATSPATPATPAPATAPTMVPLAVAKAERAARQAAEQQAAYWQGQAEARAAAAAPATTVPAVPELTPQERLAAISAERLTLADQYDQGTIRTKEWEERRIALENEQWQIQSALQPQMAPVNIAAAVWEEQETARIETAYPVLKSMAEADLLPLIEVARRQAARDGVTIEPNARGTVELRERVAKLATTMYGGSPPASQQPAATPGVHPNAAAAALAVSHPANVSQLGAASLAGGLTDDQALAQMANMTEVEQLAFLDRNPTIVARALGRTR